MKMDFTQDKNKSKQWEDDYQLVENAGLFQEYLEMGVSTLCDKFLDLTDDIFIIWHSSYAVWLYHDLCSGFPASPAICPT